MVVGNGGTGRTTFVNTLCGKKVLQGKDADDASNAHLEEGVKIKPITVGKFHYFTVHWNFKSACPNMKSIELELDEEGTRISLTIVDTPGFGDQIDNEAR
jgi:cell division control protein 11